MGGDVCWDGTFFIPGFHENVYTRRFHQDDLYYTIVAAKWNKKRPGKH